MVTFWANEFFVSEEGYEVKQGQTLRTEIVRQVPVKEARYLSSFAVAVGYMILCFIFLGLLLAICVDADTVPFWAFYDTMQLLTHLPLANVSMPGQTAVFLSTLASMLRFNIFSIDKMVAYFLGVDFEIRTTTELQRQAGYSSCYILINLSVIIVLVALVAIVYVVTKVFDKISEYSPERMPAPNGRTNV